MTTSPPAPLRRRLALLFALPILAAPGTARAHAYLQKADPKVGSTVEGSPRQVRIWFDGALEPAFSSITVHGPGDGAVGDGHGRVDASDPKLLETDVPPLAPGTYRVRWSVVARDGHRTSGDYQFTVR